MNFLEKIFDMNKEEFKKVHLTGLIGLTLVVFKLIFTSEFNRIISTFKEGIGKLSFLINLSELITGLLLILSVATVIITLLFLILYVIIDAVYERTDNKSERLINTNQRLHNFFIGSKLAVLKINRCLVVSLCYFYVLDESHFTLYKNNIIDFTAKNNLLTILMLIYFLVIFGAFFSLIKLIVYKFLYFQVCVENN